MTDTNNPNTGLSASDALNQLDTDDIEALLKEHQRQLMSLSGEATPVDRALIELEISSDLLALDRKKEAWFAARKCFTVLVQNEQWQQAAEACDVLYQCDHDESIIALGHGVWLGVTYPIEAQTTVGLLQHIIDETPATSDGAAVAAMTASYIVNLRASDEQLESLQFLTTQIISKVAKEHSQIDSQDKLDFWIERLELNDHSVLLSRLASILNIMVTKWWFDRDELRAKLPVN